MPLAGETRWFLSAALADLSVAGALLLFDSRTEVLAVGWDALLWLLLIGFVGCTTQGFALHLFSAISRRPSRHGLLGRTMFALTQGAAVLGAAALFEAASHPLFRPLLSLAAAGFLISVILGLARFASALTKPKFETPGPENRPGDLLTVPLFLVSWAAAAGAGLLFVLAGTGSGPGFGWWLSAVHLFVLGHVTLLITAVALRLVPRSIDADVPRAAGVALVALGVIGASLVPVGMLAFPPARSDLLAILALPEAGFAVLLTATLAFLGFRARTTRPELGLELTAGVLLLLGGGIGLWMVSTTNLEPAKAHALVNILGFVGLFILVMWFGMIAPFQRISHAWTRRMLWGLAAGWLGAVGVLASVGATTRLLPGFVPAFGGGLLLAVALAWGVGTMPVLFPRLNPLPGVTTGALRSIRGRWGRR